MSESKPYNYDYRSLDEFLHRTFDPKEVGNQLDTIMSDLVHLASKEDDFGTSLRDHHYLLKELRDIFWWKLQKNQPGTEL
jgi:hypothetical protein